MKIKYIINVIISPPIRQGDTLKRRIGFRTARARKKPFCARLRSRESAAHTCEVAIPYPSRGLDSSSRETRNSGLLIGPFAFHAPRRSRDSLVSPSPPPTPLPRKTRARGTGNDAGGKRYPDRPPSVAAIANESFAGETSRNRIIRRAFGGGSLISDVCLRDDYATAAEEKPRATDGNGSRKRARDAGAGALRVDRAKAKAKGKGAWQEQRRRPARRHNNVPT